MPIRDRTAKGCVDFFVSHISELVAATIPTGQTPFHSWRDDNDDFAIVGFRRGAPASVPLETRYGRIHFYLSQAVDAAWEDERNSFRLRTLRYWYRLQVDPDPRSQALIRWEYDRRVEQTRHSRHHVQLPASLPAAGGDLDLNKLHLPTGWVTIEAVIRFLIVDLGVEPPCGKEWADRIHASEQKFFQDFTGKREPALP